MFIGTRWQPRFRAQDLRVDSPVFNLGWDSRQLPFPGFFDRFLLRSRSPGSDGCSTVRASWSLAPPTRTATPNSKDICRDEETRRFYSSFLENCFAAVAPRRVSCDRPDFSFSSPTFGLSALLMLPLSPDSLGLRAAIGLIDPLGLALLGGCLPLPLFLRGTTTRAFSGHRPVLGTRSLHIPMIYLVFLIRHVFCFRRWNGCWGVRIQPGVVSSIRKTSQSHRRVSYRWSYAFGLYTAAVRSDP